MPASPIRKLVPYAEAAKQRGVKIYHLNIGQPDIRTPDEGWNAIRGLNLSVLAYSPSTGFDSYRQKLVDYYAKYAIEVDKEQILVTTGGSEAIAFGLMSCLDPGDEVIIPEPFYANYNGFSQMSGLQVKPITAKIEDNFALPPIANFEQAIGSKTKAILICNPGNPTGYLYSKEELEQLAALVKKYDLFLFADEVYREFVYGEQPYTSILHIEGLEEHAVVMDSISKRYSACGARIGAMVTRNKTLIETALKFAQARLSPPTLAQVLAEATLDTPDSYLQEVKEEYDKRRQILVNRLRQIPGVTCPNPGGAFYAFVRLPIEDADHFCQWMLESFEHEGETVMMAPGTGFYASPGLGKQEVRFAYVLRQEDLERALDCLEAGLKAYPGNTLAAQA